MDDSLLYLYCICIFSFLFSLFSLFFTDMERHKFRFGYERRKASMLQFEQPVIASGLPSLLQSYSFSLEGEAFLAGKRDGKDSL